MSTKPAVVAYTASFALEQANEAIKKVESVRLECDKCRIDFTRELGNMRRERTFEINCVKDAIQVELKEFCDNLRQDLKEAAAVSVKFSEHEKVHEKSDRWNVALWTISISAAVGLVVTLVRSAIDKYLKS